MAQDQCSSGKYGILQKMTKNSYNKSLPAAQSKFPPRADGRDAAPYLDFNTWLRQRFGERVQKITVDAGLTCPNRDGNRGTGGCIYCNERGSGTGQAARGLSLTEQIQRARTHIIRRYKAHKYLVYFQSYSNTYAPVQRLRELYDEALSAASGIVGLSIGTRPDCVDEEKLALLGRYGRERMVWLEYGMQSIHDRTLARINRGHDAACFRRAVDLARRHPLLICAHVILGLPGESREDMMESARAVAEMELDGVKLHLLYVIKGTELERMHRRGDYRCLTRDGYVDLVCEFIERLPRKTVIQRVTGEPHSAELAAPQWSLDKRGVIKQISETFVKRGVGQGGFDSLSLPPGDPRSARRIRPHRQDRPSPDGSGSPCTGRNARRIRETR